MPLIIVCGRPASGKSYITTKITSAFVKKLELQEKIETKPTTTTTTSQADNKLTNAVEQEDKNKNITTTGTQADISPSSTSISSSFNTSNTQNNTITTQNADALSENSQTLTPKSENTPPSSFPVFYKNVIKISDSDALKELNLHRNEAFENTHKLEKRLRGNLKAAVERALANKNNLVILDHGNYIKGWRYELHCMAKSTRTKSMILYIEDNDEGRFLENNLMREDKEEAYSEEIQKIKN